jgi:hypothetical protein
LKSRSWPPSSTVTAGPLGGPPTNDARERAEREHNRGRCPPRDRRRDQ